MTYVADHVQASKSGRAEHNNWWHGATTAQRLAQLDGGLECGMTAGQIASVSGTTQNAVWHFASTYGRRFKVGGISRSHQRARNVTADRSAYLRGERVDLWGSEQRQDEFALDEVEA